MIDRRSFLTGLIAAPAVIRLATLMPIVPPTMTVELYRLFGPPETYGESESFEVPIARTTAPGWLALGNETEKF